jgi:hypothetical protein
MLNFSADARALPFGSSECHQGAAAEHRDSDRHRKRASKCVFSHHSPCLLEVRNSPCLLEVRTQVSIYITALSFGFWYPEGLFALGPKMPQSANLTFADPYPY